MWSAAAALVLAAVVACDAPPAAVTRVAPAPSAVRAVEKITYPARGHGKWRVAAGAARTAGTGGPLLRYRVLVETDIRGLPAAGVADAITRTLADPRGWTAGGTWRLRRVGPGRPYDFTIYLATPGTRDGLCASTDGYTSCRNGDNVVLNVARWVKSVPGYGSSPAVYRQYMVNHEVGHRLGHGHELCEGRGRPAPVMQQQTLGLHGCAANPWPYLRGSRYTGPPGAYADPQPPPDRGTT